MSAVPRSRLRPRLCASQRGAALLAAMLTVTLVAGFAASALWQQWRATEVEAAERARVQSSWLLMGALAWSRVILREDYLADQRSQSASAPMADHLAEPWAVPLQEARLTTFLAADKGVAQAPDASTDTTDAFLSGEITDLQSRLNLRNLVSLDGAQIDPVALAQWQRLFSALGLPPSQLQALASALQLALRPASAEGAINPAAPLLPATFEQLRWLGVSAPTLAALAPHATLLPQRSTLNLNTASAEAIAAALGIDRASAQAIVTQRQMRPLRDLTKDLQPPLPQGSDPAKLYLGVNSRWFEVRGRLRLGATVVQERALVERNGSNVMPVWRERGAFTASAVTQGAR